MAPPGSLLASSSALLLCLAAAVLLNSSPAAAQRPKFELPKFELPRLPREIPSKITKVAPAPPPPGRVESSPPRRASPPHRTKRNPPPGIRRSMSPPMPRRDYIGYKYKNKVNWVYIISTERYNYEDAYQFCTDQGYYLVPYNDKILNEPTKAICYDTGKGCWLSGRQVNYCAYVDIRGNGGAYAHACDQKEYALCWGKMKADQGHLLRHGQGLLAGRQAEKYNYEDAYRFCTDKGYYLVPYNDKILNEPTKAICYDTGKGCWLGGRQVNYCAYVDIRGNGGAYARACDQPEYALCWGKIK
ncbi:hypothetical protein TSOC_010333 [Tetrabaena socialis]|uniref:C-type lectin domain-containing protein n=1 Tax=Tetrabaena socialis TaxID=47790 RepID=A0A2J7ZTL8_9CHLO|nr:hypothetical protein TSOC_010333 [Tetrabaena socialis]|eukprot:PNH03598.1 hypothetical protein TSOC_010333 [Tetrabaena socialis]